MTVFDPTLLADYAVRDRTHPAFAAVTNAHGLYNTQQFVLRLSPVVHRKLAECGSGVRSIGEIGYDGARAMSTLLHETVHWWQHIGSTYGFIFSLIYPVQAHCTHFDLLKLVAQDGFKKSVLQQASELGIQGPGGYGTTAGLANSIVNNHFDLLAFRAFSLGPKAARAITGEKLFQAVGHSFHMAYAHAVSTIAATVDPPFEVMPHPKEWQSGFELLREQRIEGYYYRSPVGVWPIGSVEIFEGQACFSQIQYLSHACDHRLEWSDYRELGLLHGVYETAFREFLRLTGFAWPRSVDDPLVPLFILVCDLSLNPGSGFPYHIRPNFRTFIDDVNPGARFAFFCLTIAKRFVSLKTAICDHSRSDYAEVSGILCEAIKEPPPLMIAKTFSNWFAPDGAFANLRNEYIKYEFDPRNYVIRHLFAHFLAFQEDKFRHPEFFCWPGAWMAGSRLNGTVEKLFDKHGALFVDKEDSNGVFARIQKERDPACVQATYDKFYHDASTFDLSNQWISQAGPFRFDLSWISPEATAGEARDYFARTFHAAFGIDLHSVRTL